MNKKRPTVCVLRSEDKGFVGAYPYPDNYDFPSKYPAEDAFLHGSVASANDCTGICVKVPEDEAEAISISEIRDIPVTCKHGDDDRINDSLKH